MQGFNGTGVRRHNGRDTASQRLADDEAVRLDARWQYQQVGGIPFPGERVAVEHSGHGNPFPQPGRRDFCAYSSGVVQSSSIRADEGGRPGKVGDLR